MIRSFPLALVTLLVAGCATGAIETRVEDLTIGPLDQPWVLRLQAIAQGDTCTLGLRGAGLVNNGQTPLGGSFVARVTDASKEKTIGELNLTCETASPGGTSNCTSVAPLTFRCQFVHIDTRAVPSPR